MNLTKMVSQHIQFLVWSHTIVQWIPFLMFENLNSCWCEFVCAKIMPRVGKNLLWCALLPNVQKNQKRKLVSSQIRLVHSPTLGCYNVTNSQFSVDLWTCQAASIRYNSVPLGWVYNRVSLSVWPMAVVRLVSINKARLTGREVLLCLCWLLFQ